MVITWLSEVLVIDGTLLFTYTFWGVITFYCRTRVACGSELSRPGALSLQRLVQEPFQVYILLYASFVSTDASQMLANSTLLLTLTLKLLSGSPSNFFPRRDVRCAGAVAGFCGRGVTCVSR